jgi:hypothetical protein
MSRLLPTTSFPIHSLRPIRLCITDAAEKRRKAKYNNKTVMDVFVNSCRPNQMYICEVLDDDNNMCTRWVWIISTLVAKLSAVRMDPHRLDTGFTDSNPALAMCFCVVFSNVGRGLDLKGLFSKVNLESEQTIGPHPWRVNNPIQFFIYLRADLRA